MPLRIPQPIVRQLLERGHVDATAERRPCREPRVVVEDDQYVRGTNRCFLQLVGCPIGLRVANVELDDAFEWPGHVRFSQSLCMTRQRPAAIDWPYESAGPASRASSATAAAMSHVGNHDP